jgi:uncharacterized protein YdaU (DUF1376 family)
MHYYQFNIADYRKDTSHLTPVEHYIYRTLIDSYYLDEKPIPKETQPLLRRLSIDFSLENSLLNVLNDFFVLKGDFWHHKRIDVEILDYKERCEKNSINGKLGGRPKKTQSLNFANPNESELKPNQEPLTNNHKPITKKQNTTAAADVLFPDIQDRQIVNDWVKVRKAKNLPVTKTAIQGFIREVDKSGWKLEDVVRLCCERGWGGFKAAWLATETNTSKPYDINDFLRSHM